LQITSAAKDLAGYIVGQVLGAIAAAGVLTVIAQGRLSGYGVATKGLGQNGWGEGYLAGFSLSAGVVFEFVATLIFVIVILGSTQGGAPGHMAGLAIGITLVAIHIFGINITGVSVNSARSLGPALLVGGKALSQVWMFLLVPSIAGIVSGVIARTKVNELICVALTFRSARRAMAENADLKVGATELALQIERGDWWNRNPTARKLKPICQPLGYPALL